MVGSPPPNVRLATRRHSRANRRNENDVMTIQYLLQNRHASACGFSRGVAIIGIVRGKWCALSASVTLLALVGIAVTMLSRVSAKKTKPVAPVTQTAPQAEIHLSG